MISDSVFQEKSILVAESRCDAAALSSTFRGVSCNFVDRFFSKKHDPPNATNHELVSDEL